MYKEIQNCKEELQRDLSKRDRLMVSVDELITNLRYISRQMVESKNYADHPWLEKVATEWQVVFSRIFVEPRNIRKEIELPSRPPGVLRSGKRTEIPYSKIHSDIERHACRIGENRKLADLQQRIQELEWNRSRIHREILSSAEEERQDWHNATVYFAADVLAGGPDLAYQLDAGSYWQLEQVFLDEVKRLNAHHVWQDRGDGWELSEMEGDYLDICEKLRQMLLNPNIKAPAADFANVQAYLIRRYHIDKGFPARRRGSAAAEELKQRKAQRIWESKLWPTQSTKQMKKDWQDAEKHAALFYDNVIPAVEGKPESMEKVLKAFLDPWRQYGVINCFEAAIAIYFFDPNLIRECCNDEHDII